MVATALPPLRRSRSRLQPLPAARPRVLSILGGSREIASATPLARRLRDHVEQVVVEAAAPALRVPTAAHGELDALAGTDELQLRASEARIAAVLDRERPDVVAVHGDTNGVLAGARAAVARFLPLIRLDAGARTGRADTPNERNRVLTDHLADLLLAPNGCARDTLRAEGVAAAVRVTGDLTCDLLLACAPDLPQIAPPEAYVLAVLRDGGRDDARLDAVMECLALSPWPVLLAAGAAVRARLDGGHVRLPPNVRPLRSVRPVERLALERGSRLIATDGGDVEREAYIWGVPCVTLAGETPWPETVLAGWNALVDCDPDRFLQALWQPAPALRPPLFGDGRAAERIAAAICEFIDVDAQRTVRRWTA